MTDASAQQLVAAQQRVIEAAEAYVDAAGPASLLIATSKTLWELYGAVEALRALNIPPESVAP